MHAPTPFPAIRTAPVGVGVTGHRLHRLPADGLDLLGERVRETLEALAGAAPGSPFRLVTALAEGADSVAADGALALGWRLDAVLPLPREEYRADFADAGRATLEDQLARAHAVFELPGTRDEHGGAAPAYERAGRIVLAQSDLLFAIWDGEPAQGRGGAAQIVAEAVAQGLPVLHLDPGGGPVRLLWSGLDAHDFGPESVETVARGGIADLPRLLAHLAPAPPPPPERPRRFALPAIAYPLLLALTGVRRLRRADLAAPVPGRVRTDLLADCVAAHCGDRFDAGVDTCLGEGFAQADTAATRYAQLFRSAYVSSFALAALAVLVSLAGLLLPPEIKPFLVAVEFVAIVTILVTIHRGSRGEWHRKWLDNRLFAERLRCLGVSSQLGDLELRTAVDSGAPWVGRSARAVARALALPAARVDGSYLEATRGNLRRLLDGQIAYLDRESGRMHRLEHRLHRFGTLLFATTAVVCALFGSAEAAEAFDLIHLTEDARLAATAVSAALPTMGAAIYGIRMQGDFAGSAERSRALAEQLARVRTLLMDEEPSFDTLRRLARRVSDLLTQDVIRWFHAYLARPLSLPG